MNMIGNKNIFLLLAAIVIFFTDCGERENERPLLQLTGIYVGLISLDLSAPVTRDVPVDQPVAVAFSLPVDVKSARGYVSLQKGSETAPVDFVFSDNNKSVVLKPLELLQANEEYTVVVGSQLKGERGEAFNGAQATFKTIPGALNVIALMIGGQNALGAGRVLDIPLDAPIEIEFSTSIDPSTIDHSIELTGPGAGALQYSLSNETHKLILNTGTKLKSLCKYTLVISGELKGAGSERFEGFAKEFYTRTDSTPRFPLISDEELLTLVQRQTFKYFWDFAHPISGMARERNTSGETVTTGGSGFGVMTIVAAIERGFISREEGRERIGKIIAFLESADRFHGAWPHWLNGSTGKTTPFSANDNGGDLVETALLIQGLLTVRQYLNGGVFQEKDLMDRITKLWEEVEWDWYTRNGENVLYWHWSPDFEWRMNHKIQGWNEALIVYILAASSKTHGIKSEVYHQGWARNGNIKNGGQYFDVELPLGEPYGGPLFFSHYSFLGLDPRKLKDHYANYWEQNIAHSLINHAYCLANPKDYAGYGGDGWGLTAGDGDKGYSAHSPANDRGVITPSAALSSFPYTPGESLKALKWFYYTMGDKLWGEYGFYDGFNPTENWYANSCLAIDQGPIVIMIENFRTGLFWNLLMSDPDIQTGLSKLGFTY